MNFYPFKKFFKKNKKTLKKHLTKGMIYVRICRLSTKDGGRRTEFGAQEFKN